MLLIAALASAVLAVHQLGALDLPGCGFNDPCGRAARSAFGSIPGLGWPTSFVGAAYFIAASLAWTLAGRCPPRWICWILRAGALASILLSTAMAVGGYLCAYCATVHAANLLAWVIAETLPTRRGSARAARIAVPALIAFVLASLVLGIAQDRQHRIVSRQVESDLASSTRQLVEAQPDDQVPGSRSDPEPTQSAPFTGRYTLGASPAPIRIVVFTDYQCPHCQQIEDQLMALVEQRDDVSLSVKHFPFCSACNRYVPDNRHPSACRAARAAEAAGLLGGSEAFWAMHRWLFDHRGSFTDAVLRIGLEQMNLNANALFDLLDSDQTLAPVQADIDEAMALGLRATPMIFINGVQLRGWNAPNAITRAVQALAATNPPPLSPDHDHPPSAVDKFVDYWRAQPEVVLPPDTRAWPRGSLEPAVQIVMFGDALEPAVAQAHAAITAILARRPDVRYTFRHYPLDRSCNPVARATIHPGACLAARAVEAAGAVGGADAYWAMLDWILAHQDSLDEQAILDAAESLGLDPDIFASALNGPDATAAIIEDAQAFARLRLRAVPAIFINSRPVPNWRLDGVNVLERICQAAANQ